MESKIETASAPKTVPVRKNKPTGLFLALKKKNNFSDWDIDGDYQFEKMLGARKYG